MSGEPSTDEDIYRKHADELVRFATGLVGPVDAPDVVTDACLKCFRSPGWRSVTNRRAYLYRSVFNQAQTHQRSAARRRRREQQTAAPEAVHESYVDVDVLEAVEQLSVRQRAVIVLTYWEDLTPDDVATRLGISRGSVKRHLSRARSNLRGYLDE